MLPTTDEHSQADYTQSRSVRAKLGARMQFPRSLVFRCFLVVNLFLLT
jgi:hypothetical protein